MSRGLVPCSQCCSDIIIVISFQEFLIPMLPNLRVQVLSAICSLCYVQFVVCVMCSLWLGLAAARLAARFTRMASFAFSWTMLVPIIHLSTLWVWGLPLVH